MMPHLAKHLRGYVWILLLSFAWLAFGPQVADALEVFAMRGAPDSQSFPEITAFSSISDFRSDTSGSTTIRNSSQSESCDFAIVNGTVYYIGGNAATLSDKTIFSWPSIADWAEDSNVSNLGTRSNASAMSGMAIYQNQLYILEGSMDLGGNKTLVRYDSIDAWVNPANPGYGGVTLGTRSTNSGIGFDIDPDGLVYFLGMAGNGSPNTTSSGTLYSWPTITDFIANTNITNYGGQFNFFANSSPNLVAGLAVVPEPSTWILAGIAALAVPMITRQRLSKQRTT